MPQIRHCTLVFDYMLEGDGKTNTFKEKCSFLNFTLTAIKARRFGKNVTNYQKLCQDLNYYIPASWKRFSMQQCLNDTKSLIVGIFQHGMATRLSSSQHKMGFYKWQRFSYSRNNMRVCVTSSLAVNDMLGYYYFGGFGSRLSIVSWFYTLLTIYLHTMQKCQAYV